MIALAITAPANNVTVRNVDIRVEGDGVFGIVFDIAWDHSWRDALNYDACWVFAKYSPDAGTNWNHVTLATSGTNPQGFSGGAGTRLDIVVPIDRKGAFLQRAATGTGGVANVAAKLAWNAAADGVTVGVNTRLKVFAIEMVYVAGGRFYAGDGATSSVAGQFQEGAGSGPLRIGSESSLTLGGGGAGSLGNHNGGNMAVADDFSDSISRSLPDAFPKGFGALYLMKTEISQRQYRDFLNTLTRAQQNRRTATQTALRYALTGTMAATNRQAIRAPATAGEGPIAWGCDINDDGVFDGAADGQWVACNFLSWADGAAYADWAALRPMTELEFEKAARGPADAVAGEYAWGDAVTGGVTAALSQPCTALEQPDGGNCNHAATNANAGPFRCGSYARADSDRRSAGAGYWGALDLSGSLWEQVVTVGQATGRQFRGTAGDGVLTSNGCADVADWPGWIGGELAGADGAGLRGGAWDDALADPAGRPARISDRSRAGYGAAERAASIGWRAARTAPDVAFVAPGGMWLTARKSPDNRARADLTGHMTNAPGEVWRCATGGDIASVKAVRAGSYDCWLVQAGVTLQLLRADGTVVWNHKKPGVTAVLRVDDFDLDGASEALVTVNSGEVALMDVATGGKLWQWQLPESTFVCGYAFHSATGGVRFICFPQYSTEGYCFDFAGNRTAPSLLWQRSYAGYEFGYGPSVVVQDMDADGKPDLALSGKVSPSTVYQAVLNIDTGAVKYDGTATVSGESAGRPYGLFEAVDLDRDSRPDFVMLSCQVEEYISVVRNTGSGLTPLWGQFIEKDYPGDDYGLHPQPTSMSDVQGTGKVEMIVGLWTNNAWTTAIIDPLSGFNARRANLAGYFFWGCHDVTGDGIPEIIVSREAARRPARVTTLVALDGGTLATVAALTNAAVFTSGDSALPPDSFYIAIRANAMPWQTGDGFRGILVRTFTNGVADAVRLWGGKPGAPPGVRPLGLPEYTRVDLQTNGMVLSSGAGAFQAYDADLEPLGPPLTATGRSCSPLLWEVDGRRELVFDAGGTCVKGGIPNVSAGTFDSSWSVPGTLPALHLDAQGVGRLTVADVSDSDFPAAVVYPAPVGVASALRIPLSYPPYLGLTPFGRAFRVLVNLETGQNAMALGLACYDATGALLWADGAYGAHPRIPAAADLTGDGEEEAIADDHGMLRIHDSTGAVIGSHPGWPPAYTLPIIGPFAGNNAPAILRTSGIWGMTLNQASGTEIWAIRADWSDVFRWWNCLGAVAQGNAGEFSVGLLTEGGVFECFNVRTGVLRWSYDLAETPAQTTSIVAGDLNGDGKDEFLIGFPSGRLVALTWTGAILWDTTLDAVIANPIVADVDGDGITEIVLSTSDGYVRIFR